MRMVRVCTHIPTVSQVRCVCAQGRHDGFIDHRVVLCGPVRINPARFEDNHIATADLSYECHSRSFSRHRQLLTIVGPIPGPQDSEAQAAIDRPQRRADARDGGCDVRVQPGAGLVNHRALQKTSRQHNDKQSLTLEWKEASVCVNLIYHLFQLGRFGM